MSSKEIIPESSGAAVVEPEGSISIVVDMFQSAVDHLLDDSTKETSNRKVFDS